MKLLQRAVVAVQIPVLSLLLVCAAGAVAWSPAVGQTEQADEPDVAQADAEQLTQKQRQQQAKEQRIADYLRKKEEKRLRREQDRLERQAQNEQAALARELEKEQLATPPEPTPAPVDPEVAAAATAADAATPVEVELKKQKRRKTKASSVASQRSGLPRNLARAQENVRRTALGQDPTVQRYLTLIDNQLASAEQLAVFANFVADNGMAQDALQYYDVALRLEKDDPVLWVNAGTLHRQVGDLSAAAGAYSRALSIDGNYALAHYNLGAVLDEQNKYEDAVEEYKIALTLDPNLGDPVHNPAAANNDRLLAVKLMLYGSQSGSLGTPLVDIPNGHLQDYSSER